MNSESSEAYSKTGKLLHWVIAALVLLATGLSLFRETFEPWETQMISAHKVVGLIILLVAIARVVWRIRNRRQPRLAGIGSIETRVARIVHSLLYALAVFIPLAGWIFVSLAPDERPVSFRGGDSIPELPLADNDDASFVWHEIHEILGFIFVGLFLLHFAGLLRQYLTGHREVVERMLPRSRVARVSIGILVALWILGFSMDFLGVRAVLQ